MEGGLTSVSRETSERLQAFEQLLIKWNKRINLIARKDQDTIRTRHIQDSAQLVEHLPDNARDWLDLGSGGGFPGLVVAAMTRETRPDLGFTLVESDTRKAAFLREAARALDLRVRVEAVRIEDLPPRKVDVISARALAPLPTLLALSERFCRSGTTLLFLKGRTVESELTHARQDWHITADRIPSVTDPDACILKITGPERHS